MTMNAWKIWIVVLVVVAVAASPAWAVRKTGSNGAKFLDLGVGARMVALGSAVTALRGDVNSMFWNPAGIWVPEGTVQATFSYNRWIAELGHSAFAITRGFGDLGTFGVGLIRMGLSDIEANRDLLPDAPEFAGLQIETRTEPTYDYSDVAVMLSYARALTDHFTFGGSFKYILETIDEESANAVAFDVGSTYWTGFRDLVIGARVNNLGSDLKFFDIGSPIPLTFSVGARMSILNMGPSSVAVEVDATKPKDNNQGIYAGVEYDFSHMAAVRFGYKLNYSGVTTSSIVGKDAQGEPIRDDDQNLTAEGFSLGAGGKVNVGTYGMVVDYAFTSFDTFDHVHRFTVGFELK
jgi:hypothetical protein